MSAGTMDKIAETQTESGEIDAAGFRKVMGGFATGVAVVTAASGGELHGMTVNSLTAVSLEPMLLLVCLTRDSRTASAVIDCGQFAVNLLSRDQRDISNSFARRGEDHFDDVDVEWVDGVPTLGGGLGHIICRVERVDDGGDHHIVLGAVLSGRSHDADPLLFFRGRYGSYRPAARTKRDIGMDWFG